MSEDEQVQQRRSNLSELAKLGVEIYPRTFERRHTITELVDAHGARTHDELEGDRIETITAGRILAIRAFGKANFLVLSDGQREAAGLHPAGLDAGAGLQDLQAARFRRLGRCRGAPVPDQDQRAHDLGVAAPFPLEVPGAATGEVARPDRRRDPLPAALPRSDRQSGFEACVRDAEPDHLRPSASS